jgi:hypothetical protein
MKMVSTKVQSAKSESRHHESSDVLGLSMLSLTGFQIYHICDKKLFPYSLITDRKAGKSRLR